MIHQWAAPNSNSTLYWITWDLLVHPETVVSRADYVLLQVFSFFLFSMQDLQDASANRHEILHGDQY